MLWTIFVILLVLWLLGLVSGYAIGGFIHFCLCRARGATYQHHRRPPHSRIGKRTLFALLDARHVRANGLDVGRLDFRQVVDRSNSMIRPTG